MELLFVVKGNDQGGKFELAAEVMTIGRGNANMIRLHDAEVSRRHAEIRREGGELTLVDLNSSNGVYVNGEKVSRRVLINGDQVQIGRTLLLYSTPIREEPGEAENPSVDFLQEKRLPEQSRIVHSWKQEEGKEIFEADPSRMIHEDWFNKAKAHLNLIYHTTLVVSQTLDIDRLLYRIMDLIFEWVEIDRGCILLYSPEENALVPKVSRRRNRESMRQLTISQAIIDYVTTRKEGVLTNETPPGVSPDSMTERGVKEAICVPMLGRYGLVGMIYIDITSDTTSEGSSEVDGMAPVSALGVDPVRLGSQFENRTFSADAPRTEGASPPAEAPSDRKLTADHLKLMFAIGHQAALAVEDTQYYLAMMQSERLAAVGQTVAILSHHIKNILQGIRGGSFLIEKGLSTHDEIMIGKGWGIVDKNQNKISDLILDMLTFSKERTPVFEKEDVNQMIEDVGELMQGRSMDLGMDLEVFVDKTIPEFYFDAEQIHRALTNLVTNAIDAVLTCGYPKKPKPDEQPIDLAVHVDVAHLTAENETRSIPVDEQMTGRNLADEEPVKTGWGRVEIRSAFDSEKKIVSLIVDDNGPGVPEKMRDELFRPFFSKNKSSGTGLGLAVTAKIIHEHKGEVRIADSPIGGARFVIELPFVEEPPEEEE